MSQAILLKCVDCGYQADTFNVVVHGNSHGSFTYVARCPLCNSMKVKYIPDRSEPEMSIHITSGNSLKISGRRH
jgi:hypothetical protein